MTGYKTNKEQNTEKRRGKKRFIERISEEKEAEKLIKDFYENITNDSEPDRLNGNRPERGKRGESFLP